MKFICEKDNEKGFNENSPYNIQPSKGLKSYFQTSKPTVKTTSFLPSMVNIISGSSMELLSKPLTSLATCIKELFLEDFWLCLRHKGIERRLEHKSIFNINRPEFNRKTVRYSVALNRNKKLFYQRRPSK